MCWLRGMLDWIAQRWIWLPLSSQYIVVRINYEHLRRIRCRYQDVGEFISRSTLLGACLRPYDAFLIETGARDSPGIELEFRSIAITSSFDVSVTVSALLDELFSSDFVDMRRLRMSCSSSVVEHWWTWDRAASAQKNRGNFIAALSIVSCAATTRVVSSRLSTTRFVQVSNCCYLSMKSSLDKSEEINYETSDEETEEQPRRRDLYRFVDHPQIQQANLMNEFAPHQIPQPLGNMNGWLIESEEEAERDEVDSDLESTASSKPVGEKNDKDDHGYASHPCPWCSK
ncbi:hypothetical protein Tco_0704615 [Tanacetum coccineum]|uniref:Uncharacterized protein n=1 Tax=Tanacetum coccineum TaxID=301880 RepID=A0ABQ4Y2C1_9ASTR